MLVTLEGGPRDGERHYVKHGRTIVFPQQTGRLVYKINRERRVATYRGTVAKGVPSVPPIMHR